MKDLQTCQFLPLDFGHAPAASSPALHLRKGLLHIRTKNKKIIYRQKLGVTLQRILFYTTQTVQNV